MERAQRSQGVLVVDDNRDVRRLVTRLLAPLGCVVHEAATARAALSLTARERTEEFDRTAGMLLGADDYIVKPFALGEFIARIRRALDRSPTAEVSPRPSLTPRELEVLKCWRLA